MLTFYYADPVGVRYVATNPSRAEVTTLGGGHNINLVYIYIYICYLLNLLFWTCYYNYDGLHQKTDTYDFVPILALIRGDGITLIATTCSPGGAYSNWWCSLFNADLALSIAMTAVSTFVSVGFLPLNILIYVSAAYGSLGLHKTSVKPTNIHL